MKALNLLPTFVSFKMTMPCYVILAASQPASVSLERYRQGYSTINRLLENIFTDVGVGTRNRNLLSADYNQFGNLDRNILTSKTTLNLAVWCLSAT